MAISTSQQMLAVGQSLPRLSFRQVVAPGRVAWNQGTQASVIFVPHRSPCPDCDRYAEGLGAAVEGLRDWATRAVILVPDGADRAEMPASDAFLLADDGDAGRVELGVGWDRAAVFQADRWGAIYQVESVGPDASGHHALPEPEELVGLAKFIDIQCPECGVPSREWMGASPFPLG